MFHSNPDSDLRHDVLEALEWADEVTGTVGVTVRDGVVTLTGHVERADDSVCVERVAWRVPGVKRVQNAVEVDLVIH